MQERLLHSMQALLSPINRVLVGERVWPYAYRGVHRGRKVRQSPPLYVRGGIASLSPIKCYVGERV